MRTNPLLIYCTSPTRAIAEELAKELVEKRLVAGVSILPGVMSIYHWQGKIEQHEESLLFMHSTKEHFSHIETFLKDKHPYKTPCLIALPLEAGLPDFLAWVNNETQSIEK